MKKFSIIPVVLLSIAYVPSALGCIGWADGLVATLRNEHGYCSDLPTQEQVGECYEFKREYAQFWAETVKAIKVLKDVEPRMSADAWMLLHSVSLIYPQFETIGALIDALTPDSEKAHVAEEVLANVATYHAEKSQDDSFNRKDIVLLGKTQAAEKVPKCR